MLHWRTALLAAALSAFTSGCGDATKPKPLVTDVRFTVGTSAPQGSPSSPIEIGAVVENAGGTQVWHCQGCGCGDGVGLWVLGPDGNVVLIQEPSVIGPLCPDGFVPLEHGGTLGAGATFTGTLYVPNSTIHPAPTYPAPSGTYTVVASFSYRTGGPDAPTTSIERRTTFDWDAAAAPVR